MTKMAACYTNYGLPICQKFTVAASVITEERNTSQQHRQIPQLLKKSQENVLQQLQQQEQSSFFSSAVGVIEVAAAKNYVHTPKNYFVPLHVDCSVEYELPKQPKPPAGKRVEPLLMIHPCYFRKIESQCRSPFINNMPNSSRNGTTMLVGVALFSQDSNIASASTSTISLKGSSLQNHQNYNTRQNLSSHYCTISKTNHKKELQQISSHEQHKIHHNLSLIGHHDHFLEGRAEFLEHSSIPIRRAAIAIVNRTNHHHIICSPQSKNKSIQQDLLVRNSLSSKSSVDLWDQLVAVKSSISDENPNKNSASISSLCEAAECSIASNSTLGKRDTMISGNGGYSVNSALTSNNISVRIQMNKNSRNNISSSGKKHNRRIVPIRSSYGISACLVDSTKQPWNPETHITPSLCMIDQSPIATVPSNFQAGPGTAPTKTRLQNKYRTVNDNNESINTNNILTSIKKFNLRSHRVYPYLTVTSAHSENTSLALSSEPAMAARKDFQVLPQFLAAKSDVAAVSTETSFKQPLHHISCYKL